MSVTIPLRTLVAFATGLAVALVAVFVFQAWRVDAAPGDTDTTFVPITPCRLTDTRPPSQSALGAGETRTFQVHGTNGDCMIPGEATAVSMNVTATDATVGTHWTFWPAEETQPLASSLNPFPGQPPTPNAVTTPLSSGGAFNLFNFRGTVNAIIDIDGYYINGSLQDLAADIAQLRAAQPFAATGTFVSDIAQTTYTEMSKVSITAPVAGHVTITGDGYMAESTDGQLVQCGISDTASSPPRFVLWQSPTGGDWVPFSVTEVFEIVADTTVTYSLMCVNAGSPAGIQRADVTAMFTPAP